MLHDATNLNNHDVLVCDVCIVGGGAAGITLGMELNGSKLNTIILESGGETPDPATERLYEGRNVGHDYYPLISSRQRFLGGTTNHWGGMCIPFDEIDFEYRPWIDNSGWPLSVEDIWPYYPRAHEICELGRFDYDEVYWMERRNKERLPIQSSAIIPRIAQFSPPTRFGTRYNDFLQRSDSVDTYLKANLTEFHASQDGSRVDTASVRTLSGVSLTVKARAFVLATGALENARILLLSRDVIEQGIGNQNDVVGRYFMERVNYRSGVFVAEDGDAWEPFFKKDNLADCGVNGYLGIDQAWQRDNEVLNSSIHLHAMRAQGFSDRVGETLSALWDRSFGDGKVSANYYSIWHDVEPAPKASSRVLLDNQTDALGQQKIKLDWQLSPEIEGKTIRSVLRMFALEMGKQSLGRVRVEMPDSGDEWSESVVGSFHQMGTTRMSENAKFGVVDENCKVHDVDNLYVMGSSIFPTSGQANPTLTIVALAVRLGERLKSILRT